MIGVSRPSGARPVCETVRQYEPETLGDVRRIACSDPEYGTLQEIVDRVQAVDGDA